MSMTVLLLDVMGTLVHDPFHQEMPAFFGMSRDELISIKDPSAWVEFERGAIDEQGFFARFFGDRRDFDWDAFRAHVREAYRWLPGIPDLLDELRQAGAPMHVLSNYPSWYHMIERQLALSRYVPWTFVSYETGLRKPELETFRHAARTLGVDASQCVLVDDRSVNCDAARQVGMDAIRFEGVEALRRGLTARGLLRRGEI